MNKTEYEVRVEKLQALREKGIDPYPSQSQRSHQVSDFLSAFDALEKSAEAVTVAGRVMVMRGQGGVSFSTVRDGSGEVQLFVKKDQLGEEKFELWKEFIDRGDFIQATGTAFTTKRGEKSVLVTEFTLLTKTLLPLPEKWHGLQDVETRYRKRYLDLIANDEVMTRFKMRSEILRLIREMYHAEGFIEVETPMLQPIYGGGAARPFVTHHNTLDVDLYLRISTELYLKRLIAGGMEKVFEVNRIFRNEGVSYKHNPEFTMLENMVAYEDYTYNMDLIARTYEYCAQKIFGTTVIKHGDLELDVKAPWKQITMVDAVKDVAGWDYMAYSGNEELDKAKTDAANLGYDTFPGFDTAHSLGELLVVIFEEKVEETLIQPTMIYRYPVEISPLAKRCPDDPRFVERFEQYVLGQEHGNNYSELNDPIELKARFEDELQKEKRGKEVDEIHKTDEDFLEAMAHGMPPTTGNGIGIDRMVMLFTNANSIKEVILFPTMRPKED